MNTYTNDTEVATKKDIRLLREELQQDNARYYALIQESFQDGFKMFNEYYLENFRTRLGALEKV